MFISAMHLRTRSGLPAAPQACHARRTPEGEESHNSGGQGGKLRRVGTANGNFMSNHATQGAFSSINVSATAPEEQNERAQRKVSRRRRC